MNQCENDLRTASKFESQFDYDPDFEKSILGRGGYGVVFQVKCKTTGKLYAVKRVDLAALQRSNLDADLVKEREKLISKCKHPNIVKHFSDWVELPSLSWQKNDDERLRRWSSRTRTNETNTSERVIESIQYLRNRGVKH